MKSAPALIFGLTGAGKPASVMCAESATKLLQEIYAYARRRRASEGIYL